MLRCFQAHCSLYNSSCCTQIKIVTKCSSAGTVGTDGVIFLGLEFEQNNPIVQNLWVNQSCNSIARKRMKRPVHQWKYVTVLRLNLKNVLHLKSRITICIHYITCINCFEIMVRLFIWFGCLDLWPRSLSLELSRYPTFQIRPLRWTHCSAAGMHSSDSTPVGLQATSCTAFTHTYETESNLLGYII